MKYTVSGVALCLILAGGGCTNLTSSNTPIAGATEVPQPIIETYMSEGSASEHEAFVGYCQHSPGVIERETVEGQTPLPSEKVQYRNDLNALPDDELIAKLKIADTPEETGELLEALGLRLLRAEKIDDGYAILACAARVYGDKQAMLRLAKAANLEKEETGAEPDVNRSYFWILNAIYSDAFEKNEDNIMTNGLGLMDGLQNMEKYVTQGLDRQKVEEDAATIIHLRHPDKSEEEIVQAIRAHYSFILQ